jgi:hypothetical protein
MQGDENALGVIRIGRDSSLRLKAGEAIKVEKGIGNVHPENIAEKRTRKQCEATGFLGPER